MRKVASGEVLILLCGDLERAGRGMSLHELSNRLEAMAPDVLVHVEPGLCGRCPAAIKAALTPEVKHVVLGLCSGHYPASEVQAVLRKFGLDPLGLELVPLGQWLSQGPDASVSLSLASTLLAAAIASAKVFVGSRPEEVKVALRPWEEKLSRRALFTLPPLRYQPVPCFAPGRCAGERGCDLCVRECPRGALSTTGGAPALDKSRCESCGLCVAACPQEAVDLPGRSSAQLEAEVDALLGSSAAGIGRRAIVFTCDRNGRSAAGPAGPRGDGVYWLPVRVPCAGMVSVALLLRCLALGAEAVSVAMCHAVCPMKRREAIEGRLSYCRELLCLMGDAPGRVFLWDRERAPAVPTCRPMGRASVAEAKGSGLFGPRTVASALVRLFEQRHAQDGALLSHPHSPLGLVELNERVCTGCGACAAVCPTDALVVERNHTDVKLTFDHERCAACARCVSVCPERSSDAIRVARVTDVARLRQGKVTLWKGAEAVCERCGTPIASLAVLQRVLTTLGSEGGASGELIARVCPSCRGIPGARRTRALAGERR